MHIPRVSITNSISIV